MYFNTKLTPFSVDKELQMCHNGNWIGFMLQKKCSHYIQNKLQVEIGVKMTCYSYFNPSYSLICVVFCIFVTDVLVYNTVVYCQKKRCMPVFQ